ncbi:MAG: efflux RND transporter periplasmic adaptor subunit [Acidobacteria bacterium]|nr:efflux RND transporter periplasmic adaptor subunit [Acidobacteriota bacterium]
MIASSRRALSALAAVAPLVTTLACGGGATPAADPAPDTTSTAAPSSVRVDAADAAAAGIETATATTVERADPLDAAGRIVFDERRTARLGSLVEGVVHEINVQPGDSVARGAVVVQLHSHVVHDAWAGYFKALAERQRAETELTYAKTSESRAAALVADKALSPQELERAKADVNAATQAVAAVTAEITRAEQELAHYGIVARPDANPLEHEDVPVTTPFGGTVIERLATEGSAVTPGTPLLVVSDLSRVWVTAEIDESLVGRVVTGRPVTVKAAAYPGESFPGTLAAIGDVVDPDTRRVTLRIELANPGRKLKPQMLVTVSVAATAPRPVLVVPARALQTMDGESVVFVRSAADQFMRRAVTTGATVDGKVEIVRGLAAGDVVATSGAFLLKSALTAPAPEGE